MNLTLHPGHPLLGEVTLPGDKSLSHRAALFAALAEGESRIDNFLVSGVTQAMLDALTTLGVVWRLEETTLTLQGVGLRAWRPPSLPLYCGHSATTLRLLAGALAASGVPAVLDGSPGLRRRPMERIVRPLQAMGVAIEAAAGGGAPLRLAGREAGCSLHAVGSLLPVASAQVKSCLLLAGLAADGPVRVFEPALSRDHTERLLRSMGVRLEIDAATHCVTLHPPVGALTPLRLELPGDFSSAAFLIVAALITPRSDILLRRVGLNPTRTGLLDALRAMGAVIEVQQPGEAGGEPVGDLRVRSSRLRGTVISGAQVVSMIDEFPIFAVAAAFADGTTEVRDAGELRHKESDRVSVLGSELSRIGVDFRERPDGFVIEGGDLPGGDASACGDHRLALALATAGLAAQRPVTVQGAEILSQSFPSFPCTLLRLGGRLQVHAARGERVPAWVTQDDAGAPRDVAANGPAR